MDQTSLGTELLAGVYFGCRQERGRQVFQHCLHYVQGAGSDL